MKGKVGKCGRELVLVSEVPTGLRRWLLVCYGMLGMVRHGRCVRLVWYGILWYGVVSVAVCYGMLWYGLVSVAVWYGMVWVAVWRLW